MNTGDASPCSMTSLCRLGRVNFVIVMMACLGRVILVMIGATSVLSIYPFTEPP